MRHEWSGRQASRVPSRKLLVAIMMCLSCCLSLASSDVSAQCGDMADNRVWTHFFAARDSVNVVAFSPGLNGESLWIEVRSASGRHGAKPGLLSPELNPHTFRAERIAVNASGDTLSIMVHTGTDSCHTDAEYVLVVPRQEERGDRPQARLVRETSMRNGRKYLLQRRSSGDRPSLQLVK